MKTKKERLNEVYEYVRANYGIHTQTSFAEKLLITRPAMSSAMNGNESYLTNNLFQKICAAFPGVFNLGYLLTGEGTLLTNEENVQQKPQTEQSGAIDAFGAYNAALAAQKQTIDSLNLIIDDIRERLKEKDEYITNLKKQLARYNRENGYHTQPANFMASDPVLEPEK